jgi:hypothetical protein
MSLDVLVFNDLLTNIRKILEEKPALREALHKVFRCCAFPRKIKHKKDAFPKNLRPKKDAFLSLGCWHLVIWRDFVWSFGGFGAVWRIWITFKRERPGHFA